MFLTIAVLDTVEIRTNGREIRNKTGLKHRELKS